MNNSNEKKWVEKRRHPRLDWGFMIRFRAETDDENVVWNSSAIKNIGEGGCLFASDVAYPVGQTLDIKIQFPMYLDPVHVTGKVVRCAGAGHDIAVSFLEVDKTGKSELRDALNFFLKKQQRDYRIK